MQRLEEVLAWMPALQRQAAGHLEAAVSAYDGILGRLEDGTLSMADEAAAYTMARACEAYAALADWPGLEEFLARLEARSLTLRNSQSPTLLELRRENCHHPKSVPRIWSRSSAHLGTFLAPGVVC